MQQRETTESIRLILSSGDLVLRTIPLVKERITIGRRPYNDISLDHLTVSGEHAAIFRVGDRRMIRDLKSRNGITINGYSINEQLLNDGDLIQIGIYELKLIIEAAPKPVAKMTSIPDAGQVAVLQFMNGPKQGRELRLDRTITSVGEGAQVASVARRSKGYHLTHIEGPSFPLVNGEAIGLQPHPLSHFDLIELAGTIMRFQFSGSSH
jgi:pSer/pThr/pTyr-binding forkhead associated (FHA) protein